MGSLAVVEGRQPSPDTPARLLQAVMTLEPAACEAKTTAPFSARIRNGGGEVVAQGKSEGQLNWSGSISLTISAEVTQELDWETFVRGSIELEAENDQLLGQGFDLTLFLEFEGGAWWQIVWRGLLLEGNSLEARWS